MVTVFFLDFIKNHKLLGYLYFFSETNIAIQKNFKCTKAFLASLFNFQNWFVIWDMDMANFKNSMAEEFALFTAILFKIKVLDILMDTQEQYWTHTWNLLEEPNPSII